MTAREKTYVVQTWGPEGQLTNSYEVVIASAAELKALRVFLGQKWSHVAITPRAGKRGR